MLMLCRENMYQRRSLKVALKAPLRNIPAASPRISLFNSLGADFMSFGDVDEGHQKNSRAQDILACSSVGGVVQAQQSVHKSCVGLSLKKVVALALVPQVALALQAQKVQHLCYMLPSYQQLCNKDTQNVE